MSCSKCEKEVKFPVRSKLHIEKKGSFLAFGLSQDKKKAPGNIKLPVSTAKGPCQKSKPFPRKYGIIIQSVMFSLVKVSFGESIEDPILKGFVANLL